VKRFQLPRYREWLFALLDIKAMEEMQRYAERGRSFSGLSRAELEERFVRAARLLRGEEDDPLHETDLYDLRAELLLRRLPLPRVFSASEWQEIDAQHADREVAPGGGRWAGALAKQLFQDLKRPKN